MGKLGDLIRSAIEGRDVRDAIADFADSYDAQVVNAGNSNAEIVDARGEQAQLRDRLNLSDAQKADRVYVDKQIQSIASAIQGFYSTVSALTTAFPAGNSNNYVVISDSYIYRWNGNAWASTGVPFNSPVLAAGSVDLSKLAFLALTGVLGKNIFNKNDYVDNVYISVTTGGELANTSYISSKYIPILPNTAYAFSYYDKAAWYDVNKTFISGCGNATYLPATFTSPSNAVYLRVSIGRTNKDTYQVEQGTAQTSYETYGIYVDVSTLRDNMIPGSKTQNGTINSSKFDTSTLTKFNRANSKCKTILHEVLDNPFSRAHLKLLGDSIVAGVQSSDYSLTGEAIGTTGFNANIGTKCWAGHLKQMIENKYQKTINVQADTPYITWTTRSNLYFGASSALSPYISEMSGNGKYFEFDFSGTQFTLYLVKATTCSIIDVYVDNTKVQTFDLYNATTTYDNACLVSGLSTGSHHVKVASNGKNASSTNYIVQLCAIGITKDTLVKNWGVSGKDCYWLYQNRTTLVETTDDVIIVEMGTNDRLSRNQYNAQSMLRQFINYCISQGKRVILAVSPPVSLSNLDDPKYKFRHEDLPVIVGELSAEISQDFVDNYNYFLDYCDTKGITIDSLLSDGLHPNDNGYLAMYHNFCDALGIARIRDDDTL